MGITAFPFSSVIDVPTARILGRDDAGTGSAEALTNTEIFAILGTGTPSASTYLRGDGTWSAVSAGISSLNGLTDATQTFAVGTTGTNVAFSSAAGVHTLNIPDASLSARGVLTTGSQNIQGVKSFYAGIEAAYVNMFSWWGIGDGANGGVQFFAGHGIAWGSAASGAPVRNSLSGDVQLRRDAAGRLGQRSGATAQAFGLYNTFTSATSYERLDVAWASNICTIEVTAGSAGGTLRGLRIGGATTSLLGFYGATPVDQPATITDPTGGGTIDTEARTAINTIIDRLQELGLIA